MDIFFAFDVMLEKLDFQQVRLAGRCSKTATATTAAPATLSSGSYVRFFVLCHYGQ